MFVIYEPAGGDVQRFPYNPRKMMRVEMEQAERHAGMPFSRFTAEVLEGSVTCRAILLWILQRRQHPTLKLADVNFAWDEVRLEYSKQELQLMIDQVRENTTGAEQVAAVAKLEADMAEALDEKEHGEGKAQLPIAE